MMRSKGNVAQWPYTHAHTCFHFLARIHSSGMRTAGLLTVSQHALDSGVSTRGYLPRRGVFAQGGLADIPPGPEADSPMWTGRHL